MPTGKSSKNEVKFFIVSLKVKPDVQHMLTPEMIEDAVDKYIGTKNIKMIHVEEQPFKEEKE